MDFCIFNLEKNTFRYIKWIIHIPTIFFRKKEVNVFGEEYNLYYFDFPTRIKFSFENNIYYNFQFILFGFGFSIIRQSGY